MRSEEVHQCKRLRYRGFRPQQIANRMGLSMAQVELALRDHRGQEQKECSVGPDEIMDGERLEDRISRMTKEIKEGRLVIERTSR